MRLRTHIRCITTMLLAVGLSGCVVVEVGVSNPAPNLPRVAIAPFINLSSERAVDGRRFAEAYQTELQKIPGFQVIPVGVVDSALHDHQLNLDSPEDLARLADILDVDAVCLGAVTEYSPYYPPRLGLQISWYTTRTPEFIPGIPLYPAEKRSRKWSGKTAGWMKSVRCKIPGIACAGTNVPAKEESSIIRAQNEAPPFPAPSELKPVDQDDWDQALREAMEIEEAPAENAPGLLVPGEKKKKQDEPELAPPPELVNPDESPSLGKQPSTGVPEMAVPELSTPQNGNNPQQLPQLPGPLQILSEDQAILNRDFSMQPYMSYTRLFDGADAKFTAALRNYLELGGDQRSGGWSGHLHRSEDFIRFCMHRSILEMLQLHGGLTKRRFVLTSRKYQ